MIDFDRIVTILVRDNPARERGQMIWIADQLLSWYRASVDVRTYGATRDGKPNPSAKAARDAAAILWGKAYKLVVKDGAIEYLEEETRNGTEEPINTETTGRRGPSPDAADPVDLPGGGVIPAAVDRGPAVVLRNVGGVSRKGRKPGVSKIPAHLRS